MRTAFILAILATACVKPHTPAVMPNAAASDDEPIVLHTKPWKYGPYVRRLKAALANAAHEDASGLRIDRVGNGLDSESRIVRLTVNAEGQVVGSTPIPPDADAKTATAFAGLELEAPPPGLLTDGKLVVFVHLR